LVPATVMLFNDAQIRIRILPASGISVLGDFQLLVAIYYNKAQQATTLDWAVFYVSSNTV